MTRTVALVQARMGSSRLPGKMLAALGGFPVLEWVLRRVGRARSLDEVVLATTDLASDDALDELARRLGVAVFRGSEHDVLGRFARAADEFSADLVVRICADNPFVDAGEIDRLVGFFKARRCDYACNHLSRLGSGYADGFGAEVLAADLLRRIDQAAAEPRHREHVTLYLWDHADRYDIEAVPAPEALAYPELRFDIDSPQDLRNMADLVAAGVRLDTAAADIAALALRRQP